jgi:translocation and assembly module TamB
MALQDVNATARLNGTSATVTAEAALSTKGRLAVNGTVGLAAPFTAGLDITVQNALLRDPQLFETTANGTLRLQGPLTGGAGITGQITLSGTEVQIPSTSLGGAADLPGLTHLNEPAAVHDTRARAGLLGVAQTPTTSAAPFALDITVSAPNRLFIRGRGLDAELGGALTLRGTTAAVIPNGGFSLLRGRLDILGRRLTLTEAQMAMEGNLIPTVAIAASTESDGVTSTIRIDGPATDPVVSFTSSPDLPEEEILSRLLFGRDLTSLSPLQAAQLANAVATLSGRGGQGVVGRLRQGFGLDDLDLRTDDTGGAAVTAGKYLSENVYTEVVVGSEGKTEINLNLDVSDSITVRGRAGNDGSTGLGVFFEKDY